LGSFSDKGLEIDLWIKRVVYRRGNIQAGGHSILLGYDLPPHGGACWDNTVGGNIAWPDIFCQRTVNGLQNIRRQVFDCLCGLVRHPIPLENSHFFLYAFIKP
jgi:hypothetical protein